MEEGRGEASYSAMKLFPTWSPDLLQSPSLSRFYPLCPHPGFIPSPNSETHASIGLKFGKHVGQPKANYISTKFCEDPTKILVVINNYSRKQGSIY